jgi:hypothetical protein
MRPACCFRRGASQAALLNRNAHRSYAVGVSKIERKDNYIFLFIFPDPDILLEFDFEPVFEFEPDFEFEFEPPVDVLLPEFEPPVDEPEFMFEVPVDEPEFVLEPPEVDPEFEVVPDPVVEPEFILDVEFEVDLFTLELLVLPPVESQAKPMAASAKTAERAIVFFI